MPEFDMDTNQSDTHESLDKGVIVQELEQYGYVELRCC